MTTNRMISRLRALKTSVLEDGKIDWDETDLLMKAIRPLAEKHGFLFEDFERCLEKCRADGVITPEESKEIALYLDYLCHFFSNRFLMWGLVIMSLVAVGLAVGMLFMRLAAS